MKKSAEPSVYAGTVSISLLGGFSLEMNGATLTDDINRSLNRPPTKICPTPHA